VQAGLQIDCRDQAGPDSVTGLFHQGDYMAYRIEPEKVKGVIKEVNLALSGKNLNHGEIIIGLGELIGRIIVDVADNSIQAKELQDVVTQHLALTIRIGAEAQNKRIITGQ
jgi:hypothetical protein